jgi:hypothetical protein
MSYGRKPRKGRKGRRAGFWKTSRKLKVLSPTAREEENLSRRSYR